MFPKSNHRKKFTKGVTKGAKDGTQDIEGINNLRRLAENMGVLLQKLSGQLPGRLENHMEV